MNSFVIALVIALIVLAVIALVLIHNHNALDKLAAQNDALAIKVEPVIRAGEADLKQVAGQVQATAAAVQASADVAGAQPAPAQVQ